MEKRKKQLKQIGLVVLLFSFLFVASFNFAFAANPIKAILDVNKILAKLGNAVLFILSKLVWISGAFLDQSIDLSIQNNQLYSSGITKLGWEICRDLANLLFIFILIFIGISTILQLSNYGAKKLLVGVIIAALLVNFSLPLVKLVIDASNILAIQFLCKMTNGTCEAKDLSTVFANAFSFHTIFGKKEPGSPEEGIINENDLTIGKIILSTFFGSILMLIASLVLFFLGLMFIARTISLMIILILSPVAFLGMAIGGRTTTAYTNQWLDTLLKQSFFAPAALFLLYLVANFVSDPQKGLAAILKTGQCSFLEAFTQAGPAAQNCTNLIIQFIITAGLLTGVVIVAESLGVKGSKFVQEYGGKIKQQAKGYAGKISYRYAAPAAKKITEGQGRVPRSIRKIPFVTKGLIKLQNKAQAEISNYQNLYKSSSAATLKNLYTQIGTNRAQRAAIMSILAQQQDLIPRGNFTPEKIRGGIQLMKSYGLSTKGAENLKWQYATNRRERIDVVRNILPSLPPDVIKKLDRNYFLDSEVLKEMHRSLRSVHIKQLAEKGGEEAERFFASLRQLGDSLSEISANLQKLGNQELASFISSSLGRPLFISYGLPTAPPKRTEREKKASPIITEGLHKPIEEIRKEKELEEKGEE